MGGGLATSLHGDEKYRFKDYVESVRVVNASGGIETLTPDEVDGSQGTRGVILTVTIRCEEAFYVRRTEGLTTIGQTIAAVNRVRNDEAIAAGGSASCSRAQGSAPGTHGKWVQ